MKLCVDAEKVRRLGYTKPGIYVLMRNVNFPATLGFIQHLNPWFHRLNRKIMLVKHSCLIIITGAGETGQQVQLDWTSGWVAERTLWCHLTSENFEKDLAQSLSSQAALKVMLRKYDGNEQKQTFIYDCMALLYGDLNAKLLLISTELFHIKVAAQVLSRYQSRQPQNIPIPCEFSLVPLKSNQGNCNSLVRWVLRDIDTALGKKSDLQRKLPMGF